MLGVVCTFFLESRPSRSSLFQERKITKQITRGVMSSGRESIQTCSSLLELAFLARKWAIELPIRLPFTVGEITTLKINKEKDNVRNH